MAKIEDLMKNEEFIKKLSGCDTDEKMAALYKEYNVEFEETQSEELSTEELENVAGGTDITAGTLKAILNGCGRVFKATASYGVIMLAWYDAAVYKDATRHYTEDQIRRAAKNLGVGWMIK